MSGGTVVLLAPYFPPRRRVGALRPYRFAVHLPEHGWSPHVVCLESVGENLAGREQELLGRIPMLPLGAPWDRTGRSSDRADATRGSKGSTLAAWIDRGFPVDTWLPLLLWHERRVVRFLRETRPQVLWSTADPWSSHVLARRLAGRLRIPWVADFRDPWSLCPVRPAARARFARAVDRRVEASILRAADRVVFTAASTTEAYRGAYPEHADRMRTITNAFDPKLLIGQPRTGSGPARAASPRPTLDLLFFGSFRELSPVTPVLAVLDAARRLDSTVPAQIRVRSARALSPDQLAEAERAGLADCFEPFAAVAYEHAVELLSAADLLLLSTAPERHEIIPAKLFDYLVAGRPVLSLTRSAEVAELLDRTGVGEQPASVEEAARMVVDALAAKRNGARFAIRYRPREETLSPFGAAATTAQLAALLDEIAQRPTGS